jgi:hypothetical protein
LDAADGRGSQRNDASRSVQCAIGSQRTRCQDQVHAGRSCAPAKAIKVNSKRPVATAISDVDLGWRDRTGSGIFCTAIPAPRAASHFPNDNNLGDGSSHRLVRAQRRRPSRLVGCLASSRCRPCSRSSSWRARSVYPSCHACSSLVRTAGLSAAAGAALARVPPLDAVDC